MFLVWFQVSLYVTLFRNKKIYQTLCRFLKGDIVACTTNMTLIGACCLVVYTSMCVCVCVCADRELLSTAMVLITYTLLRRRPLAGWGLMERMWSEQSALAFRSTPPSFILYGCQATDLFGSLWLVEAFELMVRILTTAQCSIHAAAHCYSNTKREDW